MMHLQSQAIQKKIEGSNAFYVAVWFELVRDRAAGAFQKFFPDAKAMPLRHKQILVFIRAVHGLGFFVAKGSRSVTVATSEFWFHVARTNYPLKMIIRITVVIATTTASVTLQIMTKTILQALLLIKRYKTVLTRRGMCLNRFQYISCGNVNSQRTCWPI